jgi:hypothetical protein
MPAENVTNEPETNSFQGFSTKDGEVVKVEEGANGKAGDRPAKTTPEKPAKPAKAADDDAADDAGDEQAADPAQEQRHKSAQQRINRAVAAQRAAERRADNLQRQLDKMDERFAGLEAKIAGGGKEQRDPNEPRPDDYELGELDPKYTAAVARYHAKKTVETERTTSEKKQQDQATERQIQEFQKKRDKLEADGLEKYDDFAEVVFDDNLTVSPILVELIFDSEHGADIAYQLASDPKEAAKVSAMSPQRQAAWFGRKEAEWESSASSDAGEQEDEEDEEPQIRQPSKTTQAPLPPKRKTRGGGSTQPTSGATSDFAAFERAAMKAN